MSRSEAALYRIPSIVDHYRNFVEITHLNHLFFSLHIGIFLSHIVVIMMATTQHNTVPYAIIKLGAGSCTRSDLFIIIEAHEQ